MSYTCFPNQTPFPLPPGVLTPPAAPELIDNGPQLPPNSVDISFFDFAVIGAVGAPGDWLEALISTDSAGTDWTLALLSDDSNPFERDLCELVALLDQLPDDEEFVPALEDPARPILPPYVEVFYADAVIRPTSSWFFIPGKILSDRGVCDAKVRVVCSSGAAIDAAVRLSADTVSQPPSFRVTGSIRLLSFTSAAAVATTRLKGFAQQVEPGGSSGDSLGVEYGATISLQVIS